MLNIYLVLNNDTYLVLLIYLVPQESFSNDQNMILKNCGAKMQRNRHKEKQQSKNDIISFDSSVV